VAAATENTMVEFLLLLLLLLLFWLFDDDESGMVLLRCLSRCWRCEDYCVPVRSIASSFAFESGIACNRMNPKQNRNLVSPFFEIKIWLSCRRHSIPFLKGVIFTYINFDCVFYLL
jgi:hypothetical protein